MIPSKLLNSMVVGEGGVVVGRDTEIEGEREREIEKEMRYADQFFMSPF